MRFNVKRHSNFRELVIQTNEVTLSSGLSNEEEALDLAKELICAAEDLLPADSREVEKRLCEARESL